MEEHINNIVWWIPFKKLRNSVRTVLLSISKEENWINDFINRNNDFINRNNDFINRNNDFINRNNDNSFILNSILVQSNNSNDNNFVLIQNPGFRWLSQFSQDKKVFYYLNCPKTGFFVELGGLDGLSGSNTYFFEQFLGWKGFSVEANPTNFEKLKKNRKCDVYHCALSDVDDEYVTIVEAEGLGCIEEDISELQKSKMKKSFNFEELNRSKVKTCTFNTLMSKYPDITYIDYVSLDIEGGEMKVLSAIDFDKYKFGIFTIEVDITDLNNLVDFMYSKGYKLIEYYYCDAFFMPIQK